MDCETDLYKRAQTGEESAFYSWIHPRQANMGRFAYQLGISIEELPEFQLLCMQQLHKQLEHLAPKQAEFQLFTIVIQWVSEKSKPSASQENLDVLGFQEDQQLHTELQKLDLEQQIPLVLFYFHHRSMADISLITAQPVQQLAGSMDKGRRALQEALHLEEPQVIQRMAMLQKSYERFVPPAPVDQETQDGEKPLPAAPSTAAMPAHQRRKKTMMALGAAGLFLSAVIGVSFSVNDQQAKTAGTTEWQQTKKVTDDMVADWKSQYKAIKASSPKRLGMSSEQYSRLNYVKQADAEMERVFSERIVESLEDDPIAMQQAVDRLLRQIETPRGMVFSLSDSNPMLSKEVDGFLQNYAAKTTELQQIADSMLLKYKKELESTAVMGELSPEKLQAHANMVPEELRLLVEALNEYTLMPVVAMGGEHFRTIRDVNYLQQQQPIVSHPYAGQYLSMLSNEPYFNDSGFLMPLESIPQQLIFMEEALQAEWGETPLFDRTEVAYQQVFWEMIKGNDDSPVFSKEGKVNHEYRNAWNNSTSSNPMAFLLLPILEEMEASGWTASAQYEKLQFHDLLDALEMEKSGSLANKLPNGNLALEDEFVDLKDFDYSRIKPLYESFKTSHDLQLLAGVQPLDVLFMYHYANEIDDRDTLWHLLADSPLKPTLKTFKEQWQSFPKLTEAVAWVELSEDSHKQRVKEKIYIFPEIQSNDYDERLELILVTEKDRIWQIDYQQYDGYDLLGEDQQFKETVDSLYGAISRSSENQLPAETKPAEVAGVFFKAIEQRDIPSVRKVMEKTDWSDEEFEAFLDVHSFRPFSELAQLTFKTFFGADQSKNLAGRAEIQYESGPQNNLFEETYFMEKTPSGWRMANLDDY